MTDRSTSHITLDLSQRDSLRALAVLSSMKGRKNKVKSVLVHVKDPDSWHEPLPAQTLLALFTMLGTFSSLRTVTVDLENRTLPVESLAVLLEGAHRLKELSLRQVTFPVEPQSDKELHRVLRHHSSLHTVTIQQCQGCATIQAIMTQLSPLRNLSVIGTKISQEGTLTAAVLVHAIQNLRRLRLQDVPDLQDDHIRTLTTMLSTCSSSTSSTTTSPYSSLQEFHLSSVSLGEASGQAMTMLLLNTNMLRQVTLELGYWSKCASAMTPVLQKKNSRLTHVKLLLTGRHQASVEHKAKELLTALAGANSRVKQLTLSLHNAAARPDATGVITTTTGSTQLTSLLDDLSSNSIITTAHVDESVWKALEDTLETNHTLEQVVLQDDCFQIMDVPDSIQATLDRNRAGLSRLLYGNHNEEEDDDADDDFQRDYIGAIIDNQDNVDLVFFALSNHPTILSLCNHTTTTTSAVDNTSTEPVMDSSSMAQHQRRRQAEDVRPYPPSPTSSFIFSYKNKKSSRVGGSPTPKRFLRQSVRRLKLMGRSSKPTRAGAAA